MAAAGTLRRAQAGGFRAPRAAAAAAAGRAGAGAPAPSGLRGVHLAARRGRDARRVVAVAGRGGAGAPDGQPEEVPPAWDAAEAERTRQLFQAGGAAGVALASSAALVGTQVLEVYYFILVVRILLSWWPNTPPMLDPVVDLIYQVTEPVLAPFRAFIPPINIGGGAVDISIILAIFLIRWVKNQLMMYAYRGGMA